MYLLDTNVVSELRKAASGKAHPNVIAWNRSVDPVQTYISTIVLHELEIGVRLVERSDPSAGQVLRRWLRDSVIPTFENRTLPLDARAALQAAQWHVPDPKPVNDAYIAATAFVTRMTLVTRNVNDFDGMNVALINPWEPMGSG
jgi:predicted nucleic acid-binding protein